MSKQASFAAAGNRATAERMVRAEQAFIAYVKERKGCSVIIATFVLLLYRRLKILKIDPVMGTWHVKHGVYLDDEILQNAINQVTPKE